MKQQNDLLLCAVRAALSLPFVLVGCSDEMHVFRPNDGSDGLRLELQASIDQQNDTRADESGFADGDRFGLFVVNYSGSNPGKLTLTDNQVNNVAMAYNADANSWQSATDIYWRDPLTPADVYGYYPFFNGLSSVDTYSFEVRSDQSVKTEGEMSAYEASDFLWAKTSKATPGKKVELTFSHVMAGVKVILEQGSGFEGDAWTKLEKIVTVDNTIRTSEVNLSTGVVNPVGIFDRNVVMNPEGDAWRAVVVPQTVAAGKSTIGITIDGKSYAYTRTDGMTYTPGKLHTFTIKIDHKADSGDFSLTLVNEDITPWEADTSSHDFIENSYVTVHCPVPGMLRQVLNENKIDFNTLRNLKVTGLLTTEDFSFMRDELPYLNAINLQDIKIKGVEFSEYDNVNHEWIEFLEDDIIPNSAFYGKPSLRRIILPDNVKKIGRGSFGSLSLNSTLIIPESVTFINDSGFGGIGEGATIVLPHHLEYIGKNAFSDCNAIIQLFLSNSIKYIGDYAFWGAKNLQGILTIPDQLTFLGEGSLPGGNELAGEIVIPTSITEIKDYTFIKLNIKGGTKVTLHDGIEKIGECAFEEVSFSSGFTLPKNLKKIGKMAFQSCHFADEFIIPESVQYIDERAFEFSNLKGSLSIPSGVESLSSGCFAYTELENVVIGDNIELIGAYAFRNNYFLRNIEIGKNVMQIGTNAFAECRGLGKIVCLSKEPPRLSQNVFSGVDLQHCHLEVPEESVDVYKAASGWSEFQFISPYRELSVGLHDQKCLNRGIKRSAILYSEGEWRVKSAPSWIHIIPDHASYKEEITFTVDPLAQGSGTREGKVVFELVGKDYTAVCDFTQYDYDYPEDSKIVLQNATSKGDPVNVFIVGDGFGAEEIVNGNYLNRMNETMEYLLDIEPYRSYREHFNVSTSIAVSPDNKVATLQNRRLDRLNTFGVSVDAPVVMDYAKQCSGFISESNIKDALIIVVSNMEGFSGSGSPYKDGCALACVSLSSDAYPYDLRGLVQHYAGGQAFAGLTVEYVTHNENINGCTGMDCNALKELKMLKSMGLGENVSLSGKMSDAPWNPFIFHPKYSALVDMWEGGYKHLGVWRSESQSVMSTYIPYFNTISRYAIYKAIMRRAGLSHNLENFIANDKIELSEL